MQQGFKNSVVLKKQRFKLATACAYRKFSWNQEDSGGIDQSKQISLG